MEIVKVSSKEELIIYRDEIRKLFSDCFGKSISKALWTWAYVDCPIGNPRVAIAFEGQKIVGHYAMIPMPFSVDGRFQVGYLSMTTMVHPKFQGRGLFRQLATEVYLQADTNSFVYGYPNQNSIHGFQKHLSWTLKEDLFLINIDGKRLARSRSLLLEQEIPEFCIDVSHENFLSWRLSKPGTRYLVDGTLIYKKFGKSVDILSFDPQLDFEKFKQFESVNLLSPGLGLYTQANSVRPYPQGYKLFGISQENGIFDSKMIMSDLF